MKIRPEQMAALGQDRLDMFVAECAVMVTRRYPEVALWRSPAELDALVRLYIDEAIEYGLSSERGAMKYIEYRVEFRDGLRTSPDFEWAREILTSKLLGEVDKLARIDHLAFGAPRPDNWDE